MQEYKAKLTEQHKKDKEKYYKEISGSIGHYKFFKKHKDKFLTLINQSITFEEFEEKRKALISRLNPPEGNPFYRAYNHTHYDYQDYFSHKEWLEKDLFDEKEGKKIAVANKYSDEMTWRDIFLFPIKLKFGEEIAFKNSELTCPRQPIEIKIITDKDSFTYPLD